MYTYTCDKSCLNHKHVFNCTRHRMVKNWKLLWIESKSWFAQDHLSRSTLTKSSLMRSTLCCTFNIVCHSLCWLDLKTYELISRKFRENWSCESWFLESWFQETKSFALTTEQLPALTIHNMHCTVDTNYQPLSMCHQISVRGWPEPSDNAW